MSPMRQRPHLRLTVDHQNYILAIRLYRWREDDDEGPDLIGHLKALEEPWLYNILLDFRRFEGDIRAEHVARIAEEWIELEGDRGACKCLAVISSDLGLRSLLMAGVDHPAQRQISFFDTFDEGLDWLKSDPLMLTHLLRRAG